MTEGVSNVMLNAIGTALTSVIEWLGTILTAVTSDTGALKDLWPLMAIGIVISLIMLVVKVIKRFAWGA